MNAAGLGPFTSVPPGPEPFVFCEVRDLSGRRPVLADVKLRRSPSGPEDPRAVGRERFLRVVACRAAAAAGSLPFPVIRAGEGAAGRGAPTLRRRRTPDEAQLPVVPRIEVVLPAAAFGNSGAPPSASEDHVRAFGRWAATWYSVAADRR